MNTKLLLQILLLVGCLGLGMAIFESLLANWWLAAPETWWRGAMGCWMLIVAIRMVYPAQAK